MKDPFFYFIFDNKNIYCMRILNRNTFSEDEVTTKKLVVAHPSHEEGTLVYIGKSCYLLKDLEDMITKIKIEKTGDQKFVESLNYRVRNHV